MESGPAQIELERHQGIRYTEAKQFRIALDVVLAVVIISDVAIVDPSINGCEITNFFCNQIDTKSPSEIAFIFYVKKIRTHPTDYCFSNMNLSKNLVTYFAGFLPLHNQF